MAVTRQSNHEMPATPLPPSLVTIAVRALDSVRHADPLHGSRTLAPRIFLDAPEDAASDVILGALRGHAMRRLLSASRLCPVEAAHDRAIRHAERRRQQRVSLLRGHGDAAWLDSGRRILAVLRGCQVRRECGVVC